MDDKTLRQNVVSELDFDPSLDAAAIGVAVEGGVVTLTGHVRSYAEKISAERAAQRVKGVRAIAQEIVVRYPEDKKTADDQIAERAVSILNWDARIPAEDLMVKVQKGWVTLSGAAQWRFQREAAEAAVRRLSGVVGVTNEIRVLPKARPEDVRKKIVEALERNAEIDSDTISVAVHGDKVTLEGTVKAWYEREVAERAAWSVPGVVAVEDRLTLG